MKKYLVALLLLLLVSSNLIATEEDKSGWYVGLGYGSTAYEDDDLGRDSGMGNLDEDTDNGVAIYGGYKLNNYLSIEASFRDYGKFTYKNLNSSIEATSFAVSGNLGYPFLENQIRPFVVLGLGYVSLDYTNSPFISVDDGSGSAHFGLGVEYEPNSLDGLGFRIAYEADVFSMETTVIGGSDKEYDMSLGQLYVGVQYRF